MPKLEQFDPSRPLVANTYFRLGGQLYRKGNRIAYDETQDRVLRRLYELRRIGHSAEEGSEPDTRTPREALQDGNAERRQQLRDSARRADEVLGPSEPSEAELAEAQALVDGNTHAQLVELADGLDINAKMKKAEIALALVRAGRGTA